MSLTGAAGDLWPGAWPSGLLRLQSDTNLEQWLQACSCCFVLWAGYHVAGTQVVILGSLICWLPQLDCDGLLCLGARLPSPHQQRFAFCQCLPLLPLLLSCNQK